MALTGLQIFKLLPKTNCKDCGKPTCLAFAMALASKKASLDECPHVSDEAKAALEGASAPPMKAITVGAGDAAFEIGGETVMFRHDEKFYRQTAVAVTLSDTLDEAARADRLKTIDALQFERVGQEISVDSVYVKNESGSADAFAAAAEYVAANTRLAVILGSESADAMGAALERCADAKPLLCFATAETVEAFAALAKAKGCPLVVAAPTPADLADLTEKAKAAGAEDLILLNQVDGSKAMLSALTVSRQVALKKGFRPLGFPQIAFAAGEDECEQSLAASCYLCKYAGIVVIDFVSPAAVLPVLTARMNIYTDPQKPVQVEPKLYAVGEVTDASPLLFTTNFSLTYYTVQSDVEASRIPAYILAVDTEGTSVLTAYSGDKLNEEVVAKAMQAAEVESKVSHHKIIIPGAVAVMSGKLEEETGWEVLVGPRESSVLPKYLNTVWRT